MDTAALKSELERDEGRKRSVYQDSLGYYTIGIGHLVDARKGAGLSEAVIDLQFSLDIQAVVQQLNGRFAWFEHLDDVRQRVLVNMCFNLGIEGLSEFHKMLAAVSTGDYEDAAEEMATSLWARQVKDRAVRLVAMMRTGSV